MKQLIFILSFLTSITAGAQVYLSPGGPSTLIPQIRVADLRDSLAAIRSSVNDSANSITIQTIADLRANSYYQASTRKKSPNDRLFVTVAGYYAINDGGGGQFYWDEFSTEADNGGTIIKPTAISGAGRWKRVFGREVSVLWFGAKADNGATDNLPKFTAALAATHIVRYDTVNYSNVQEMGRLYIPGNNGYYYFSDSLLITGNVEIVGDFGIYPYYPSRLMFATNKTGIRFIHRPTNERGSSSWASVRNLEIKSETYATDTTKDGIRSNTRVTLDNLSVQYFGGNCISINTRDSGNANNSTLTNIHTRNAGLNGIFLIGQESNNCVITSPDVQNSARCGIDDESFLGNNYFGIHAAYNGIRPNSPLNTACIVGGEKYLAMANNINIQPTVTPGWENYWAGPIGGFLEYGLPWDSTKGYLITSAFKSNNTVQKTAVFGSYTEAGQGPVILGQGSFWIGGDNASGVASAGMAYIDVNQYDWLFKGNSVRLDSLDQSSANVNNTYVSLDRVHGLKWGRLGEDLSAKAFKGEELVKFYSGGQANLSGFQITLPQFDVSKLGWPSQVAYALPIVSPRLGFRMLDVPAKIRTLMMADGTPLDDFGGAGDIVLNAGPDSTIWGWKKHSNNVGYMAITVGGSGGTGTINSGSANRLAIYAAGGTTLSNLAAITANRALMSDANGLPVHSTVTATELGYVSGVTSAIQTQFGTLTSSVAAKQDGDADLTAIATLSASNDEIVQRKSGAWTNRTMAQLKTDLVLGKGDVGLGSADNTSDATKNSATATLTNKRWTARVGNTTSSATPTINTDNVDVYKLTAQAADITSMTTNLSGTPVDGDVLEIQITGTATRAITWGASFVSSTVILPTTTTGTTTLTVIFQRFSTSSYGNNKWVCVNYF